MYLFWYYSAQKLLGIKEGKRQLEAIKLHFKDKISQVLYKPKVKKKNGFLVARSIIGGISLEFPF